MSISLVTFSVYSTLSNFTTGMTLVTKRCEFWKDICVTGCNDSGKCDISNVSVWVKWALNKQDFESLLWQGSRLHYHWAAPHPCKGQCPGHLPVTNVKRNMLYIYSQHCLRSKYSRSFSKRFLLKCKVWMTCEKYLIRVVFTTHAQPVLFIWHCSNSA